MLTRSVVARVLVFVAALLGVSAVVEVAAVSAQDSVTGHAEFVNAVGNHIRYSLTAIRQRDGSVSGEVEEHAETAAGVFVRRGHGTVICFTVNGNIARVAGTIDSIRGAGVPAPGNAFILTVVDNGEGANDPPDLASTPATVSSLAVAATHCATGIERPLFPIDRGNIQVRPSGF